MRLPRVVYWNSIPSPYVVGRFNAVASRGNLDFEAWFNTRREPDRSWDVRETDWRFRARYVPGRSVARWRLHLPLPELGDARPDLLVSLYASPSFALGSFAARALGARTAFRVVPTYDTWIRRSAAKERLKHFLFRSVDGVKVPGPDGAKLARRYGVPRNRISSVTQSVDVEHYGRAREVDPTVRKWRREQLGLSGCVFLYVGRLWSGKGLDYLFEAYRSVQQRLPDISLLLVGDGVDEDRYRAMAHGLAGVTFAGFVQPHDLPGYYALADLLVFPTLGDPHGLVVEEGMAAGLPVICTVAAGDIRRRLPDEKAGYIVPPSDATQLADRMLRLAADPVLRVRFSSEGRRLVTERTHDRWASDFEGFVDRVLSMPPRRTAESLVAHAVGSSVLAAGVKTGGAASPLVSLAGGRKA